MQACLVQAAGSVPQHEDNKDNLAAIDGLLDASVDARGHSQSAQSCWILVLLLRAVPVRLHNLLCC